MCGIVEYIGHFIPGLVSRMNAIQKHRGPDGPGNPLSKVFTRAEAKRMFSRFQSIETKVYWLVKKNIPFIGKYIPRPLDYVLGRVMGWALYIIAVK
jgi:tetrahydromethanopterin S-methyltransferase subunit G